MRLATPSIVLDINELDEIKGISQQGQRLIIGAMSRHSEVLESPIVKDRVPILTEALRHVAHPAIRNRGTFGGSIALADPAAELPACCIALEAEIFLQSLGGTRSLPAEDFFLGPLTTACRPDEMVTEIRIPLRRQPTRYVFEEVARRKGDYALAGIVVVATPSETRSVFFGVGDKPQLAHKLSALISARRTAKITPESIKSALDIDLATLDAGEENVALKRHLAEILGGRAAERLRRSNRL
jgi:carbon-monoxide dehydrogenase medium subunit